MINIYSGTYGFIININTRQNLGSTTSMLLKIKQPDGTLIERGLNASHIVSPATNGRVRYTSVNGDFPVEGNYLLQLFDNTSGRLLASPIIKIKVNKSL